VSDECAVNKPLMGYCSLSGGVMQADFDNLPLFFIACWNAQAKFELF